MRDPDMDRDSVREGMKADLAMLPVSSSVEGSNAEIEDMDTTESHWCWFYLADCGLWHMFEIDPSASCSVASAQIEQNYNINQQGLMEFYTAKYTYTLDFSAMCQINVTTGKTRPIKRSCPSATGFRFICDNLALPVPCHWERIDTDEPYQLIRLVEGTHEFKDIARRFEKTMHHPIKSIQRIQNLDLWEFFCRKKTQLQRVKRTLHIEERMLFHGTANSNIQAICASNFDWRLTGSNGDHYGKGSYFALNARYSSKFCVTTENHNNILKRHGVAPPIFASEPPYKTLFLARVLIGEYTLGHPLYCRPPSKDAYLTNLYDSCVDDEANPKIFVIFDNNQMYPEYLIEFY